MTWKLAFHDQAGRDHMTRYDGIEASWDNVVAYLGDPAGRPPDQRPHSSHAPWKSNTASRSTVPPG